ncbi:MAG: TonB-dependent receptor, partial [Gammaproteobacteria bacterium]|nr:TonB-dependent receptor [Gemmatimonadota bacterium]NIU78536.1 TonB-dependent receptor [Gammaproteobacteria bacterium]
MLSLGLREDWHQRFGAVLSPSVAGSFHLGPARLRAAAGRSFRTPTWTERYYRDPANIGRPDLAPERAWSAEAGL